MSYGGFFGDGGSQENTSAGLKVQVAGMKYALQNALAVVQEKLHHVEPKSEASSSR